MANSSSPEKRRVTLGHLCAMAVAAILAFLIPTLVISPETLFPREYPTWDSSKTHITLELDFGLSSDLPTVETANPPVSTSGDVIVFSAGALTNGDARFCLTDRVGRSSC